ncbi:MAG: hypothetical protein WCR42_00270 [bacterium]
MGKGGGAGKVYFVLYLAVVLELLIIIVERDEAEELLSRKQKDTMRIVESILSQLQSGAGTEGINTRPQDEITIPPPGVNVKDALGADIKPERKYIVEVGVTDISQEMRKYDNEVMKDYKERVKKLIKLANVEQIQYQIFFSNDQNVEEPPTFPSDKEIDKYDLTKMQPGEFITAEDGATWKFVGCKEMRLDLDATYKTIENMIPKGTLQADAIIPYYPASLRKSVGDNVSPPGVSADSVFFYSDKDSRLGKLVTSSEDIKKRAFVINFQPPSQAGWFKLRFASRTNRILGVRSGQSFAELDDESTVNIGTVQLSVKDLKNVYKELKRKLEKYALPTIEQLNITRNVDDLDSKVKKAAGQVTDEKNAIEVKGNIQLYGYIAKLLVPGLSTTFAQNRGAMAIDVHVITPNPPNAPPTIYLPQYAACFDELAPVFECSISPYKNDGANIVEGKVLDENGSSVARINFTPLHQIAGSGVSAPTAESPLELRGVVERKLAPGKYKIEIKHSLRGKTATDQSVLEVFKTGLTEESVRDINGKLAFSTYYGYKTSFSAVPYSGTKIKNDQFRISLATNDNPQKPSIEGLTLDKEQAFTYTPSSKSVTLKIVWTQPYTGKEVELFAEKKVDLKQEPPEIGTSNVLTNFSGTTRKFKVSVANITASKPGTGSSTPAVVSVEVSGAEISEGLTGYSISNEPSISGSAESGYEVEFELSGVPDQGKKKARGTVTVKLNSVAVNPVSGVKSETTSSAVLVNVNYEGAAPKKQMGPK